MLCDSQVSPLQCGAADLRFPLVTAQPVNQHVPRISEANRVHCLAVFDYTVLKRQCHWGFHECPVWALSILSGIPRDDDIADWDSSEGLGTGIWA
jgi:hypothetical protein